MINNSNYACMIGVQDEKCDEEQEEHVVNKLNWLILWLVRLKMCIIFQSEY